MDIVDWFLHGYTDTVLKGGKGSGYFGHSGRPGKRGGSASGVNKNVTHGVIRLDAPADPKMAKRLVKRIGKEFIYGNFRVKFEVDDRYYGCHFTAKIYDETFSFPDMSMGDASFYVSEESGARNLDVALLAINTACQGTGVGVEIYKRVEEAARAEGLSGVNLHANIDVGGYAWARCGFSHSSDWDFQDARDRMTAIWEHRYGTRMPSDLRKQIRKAYQLAAVVGPDGYKIGKETLLGSHWDAFKPLTKDKSTDAEAVGEAYFASRKEATKWGVSKTSDVVKPTQERISFQAQAREMGILGDWIEEQKGGKGSGYFGHAGRPGKRGGSSSGVAPYAATPAEEENFPVDDNPVYERCDPKKFKIVSSFRKSDGVQARFEKYASYMPKVCERIIKTVHLEDHNTFMTSFMESEYQRCKDAGYTDEETDKHWDELRRNNIMGYQDGDSVHINVGSANMSASFGRVIFHEFGHKLYDELSEGNKQEWARRWLPGAAQRIMGDQSPKFGLYTSYSEKNITESFSESFAAYVACGGKVAKSIKGKIFQMGNEEHESIGETMAEMDRLVNSLTTRKELILRKVTDLLYNKV